MTEDLTKELEKAKQKIVELGNQVYSLNSKINRLELENERLHGQCSAFKHSMERANDTLVRELTTALKDYERIKR